MVAGYIETHGRKETEVYWRALEIVPLRHSDYRGMHVTEMNLDEVLQRRPQLVLVDELAIPMFRSRALLALQGCRENCSMRMTWYTTVNIQHSKA